MKTWKRVIIFAVIAFTAIIMGATHDPWDGTLWDVTSPDIDQPIGNNYKELYDLRKGIALRMNKEHETLATSSAGGVHKQGSARAFFQDAAPTTQVNGDAFDSGDLGSLWFDSDSSIDNCFYVLTATTPTWTPVSTEIIATLLASNRQFAGNLTVDGATTHTGAVYANGGITLGADKGLLGSSTSDINLNSAKFRVYGATGNTTVGGTLAVTGVATLGNSSQMASSTAPTTDADLANKKYVDDQITATKIKGWVTFNETGTILDSENVTSVVRDSTGKFTVTWNTNFSDADYCCIVTGEDRVHSGIVTQAAGTVQVNFVSLDHLLVNPTKGHVIAIGSQ